MLKKNFVQVWVAHDCEASDGRWENSSCTYEEALEQLKEHHSPWFKSVRLVEKTFNDEDFTITEKPLRYATCQYDYIKFIGIKEETY